MFTENFVSLREYYYNYLLNYTEGVTSELEFASGLSYYQKLVGSRDNFAYWRQRCTGNQLIPCEI